MTKSYSDSYKISDLIFISGQVGNDPDGNIPDDFESQLRNTFSNLISRLYLESLEIKNIAKLNVFLTNNNQYLILDSISDEYLGSHKPARTTLIVSALPRKNDEPEILVEIEAIAGR